MKNIITYLFLTGMLIACSTEGSKPVAVGEENTVDAISYVNFGEEITADEAIDAEEMTAIFNNLEVGDTLPIKFTSSIEQVCQKKGCWMKMKLASEAPVFVRFTDYGFFVPFNAGDHKAIVEGRAFLSYVSVDELKHYAKDAGKSQEEIDKIIEPEISFAIQADGVLIEDIAINKEESEEV